MRLPPRREKRRRSLRLHRSVFLALVAVVLAVGLSELYGPLSTIRRQHDDLARLRQEERTLLADRRLLEAEKQRLVTEEGQQSAARRRGYVRPGERRLVFSLDEKSESGEQPGDSATGTTPEQR